MQPTAGSWTSTCSAAPRRADARPRPGPMCDQSGCTDLSHHHGPGPPSTGSATATGSCGATSGRAPSPNRAERPGTGFLQLEGETAARTTSTPRSAREAWESEATRTHATMVEQSRDDSRPLLPTNELGHPAYPSIRVLHIARLYRSPEVSVDLTTRLDVKGDLAHGDGSQVTEVGEVATRPAPGADIEHAERADRVLIG